MAQQTRVDESAGSVRIGEVVEASTTEFTAQSYVLHDAPAFGSFVRTSDAELDILAVVANARTGSVDPGRRPVARGQDETDEAELYRRNPELQSVLRTEFTAVVVGFRDPTGACHHWLPRRPPHLHGFVHTCAPAEVAAFTDRLDFLPTLAGTAGKAPTDELIAACLREASEARGHDRAFLVRAGKELAILLAGDVNRLSAILRRMGR